MIRSEISNLDLSLLAVNLLTYRIFTRLPMTFIKAKDSSAFLTAFLFGAIFILAILLLCNYFFKHTKGNLLDTAQDSFGKFGKAVVSAIFIVYLIISQIFTLDEFSELLRLIAFPTSPLWYVPVFLILGGILGALGNRYSVIRLHAVFMPIVLITFALLIISTILPDKSTDTISLTLQNISLTSNSVLTQLTLYSDIALLFLFSPSREERQHMAKRIFKGGILAVILNTLFILAFTLNIPSSIAQNGQYPIYLLMKEVYFGRFFQRLDAMILLSCALSSMLYIALNLNLLTDVIHSGIGLPKKRIFPVIWGLLTFILTLNKWIFPENSVKNLVYIFSIGVLSVLIITIIFSKLRRSLK